MNAKYKLILSMIIFGTIGIFVKFIPISSGIIASSRGIIGALFLLCFVTLKKQLISKKQIKSNFIILLISGILIGLNWIFLFESFNYISVGTATLCYYLAPFFTIILSSIFLKEKITIKKSICILTALFGMALISGIMQREVSITNIKGIVYAIIAALMYSVVIILNKKMKNINIFEMTISQLFIAGIVMLQYSLVIERVEISTIFNFNTIILLIVVGIIHTGISYALYFSSIKELKTQTVAIFSYIDPVVAIILSMTILGEKFNIFKIIGAILILGSAYISEKN